ncbi:penicillin-binding transpeptidase domain-containing protein [Actinocrinis sp.]|uniref:penicillin-binding transpeptidase domain-containing protein n=1 Tax=Actinocrinis sp. TaxID=1920516 RepID=UPI002D4734CA|nr:penicillin-binding transpeptidase domain-containing protein [Actinocrinis sp.]HZP54917.1 penicillin-binding transpeptidase domain-containing protein [Actinocrinis sp.]
MTDETRPGRAASGPQEPDDALDSWFRPQSAQERSADDPEESGGEAESAAESGSDDGAAEASSDTDKADPDQALTQALRTAPDNDKGAADGDKTEKISREAVEEARSKAGEGPDGPRTPIPGADDRTQVIPAAVSPPRPYAAAAPTQAIPRADVPLASQPPQSDMAVRGGSTRPVPNYSQSWTPQAEQAPYQPRQPHTYPTPPGQAPILPVRPPDDYDDFDDYEYDQAAPNGKRPGRSRRRRGLLVGSGVGVVILVIAALILTGTVNVPGVSAKPVPTVGFSPSGADAGTDATQTGTAFLTAWQNGSLKTAANITDDPTAALAQLTAYKNDLKVSSLSLMPGTASAAGWMTFNVIAQVGSPAGQWSYSSGMATYSKSINGYTRWFVKWQPSVLFTSLKAGQKLALGQIPATANKVVDSHGNEITSANAPSLNGIVSALEKAAPTTDGTPGQKVQVENADGSVASTVVKVSDPVNTSAVKTTIDLNVQAAAQTAVNQAKNSSMVVIQPSTGNILAVANNPPNGLDTAMVGRYAPGSTFKTITTTMVLNKGIITDLNQTWDCPATLNADGITLHNSEQEAGVGKSFLWDFAQSCNNAFSRFGSSSGVSKSVLAQTAHDYYGFDQKWDVGLGQPTVYGHVPTSSSNSLAEELVGQDQITASPLTMASVAATIADGSFKQPILVPGTSQLALTPLPANTDANLKTLMHEAVASGTLAGVLTQSGAYGKTGTAEVQGKTPNSWTIAVHGDFAVAALAVGGNFGASTAGPECNTLLKAVS